MPKIDKKKFLPPSNCLIKKINAFIYDLESKIKPFAKFVLLLVFNVWSL